MDNLSPQGTPEQVLSRELKILGKMRILFTETLNNLPNVTDWNSDNISEFCGISDDIETRRKILAERVITLAMFIRTRAIELRNYEVEKLHGDRKALTETRGYFIQTEMDAILAKAFYAYSDYNPVLKEDDIPKNPQ